MNSDCYRRRLLLFGYRGRIHQRNRLAGGRPSVRGPDSSSGMVGGKDLIRRAARARCRSDSAGDCLQLSPAENPLPRLSFRDLHSAKPGRPFRKSGTGGSNPFPPAKSHARTLLVGKTRVPMSATLTRWPVVADAYLIRYFTAVGYEALDPKKSRWESRDAYTTDRFERWATRISSVVTAIVKRPDASGCIGLLGFSLGGYVAADTAAHDDRLTAIVVLYGGMPDAMVAQVKHCRLLSNCMVRPIVLFHWQKAKNS